MQRLYIDTNVMLDFLDEREPFYEPIATIITLADRKKVKLIVSPISFATIYYLLKKFSGVTAVIEKLRKFKMLCEVCIINEAIVDRSLVSSFSDFEDALQYYSALEARCHVIITRNGKDFKNSALPVMTASEYLKSRK